MKRWWLLIFVAGCAVSEGDEIPVRWFDYDTFVLEVQPVMSERCANPTCHGRPERPLSLYSPLAWRADPDRTFIPEALDTNELLHNYAVSCTLSTEAAVPDDALLLRKPLGELADTYHGGGVVFESASERDYRVVLQWLDEGWTE